MTTTTDDLYATDLTGVAWRTSSFTANNSNCVEVGERPALVAIRDSKNPEIPALRVSPEAWTAFVNAVATRGFTP